MSEHDITNSGDEAPRSRRELLGLAGLGAAGLVGGAALARAEAASAADGNPLVIGQTNAGTNKTELDTGGPITNDGAFKIVAPNADFGVIGSAKLVGAFGSAAVGVLGDGAVGGQFSGTDAAINLEPRLTPGPPGGTNFKGDVAVDSNGVLWLCVVFGAPGAWIKLSHGGVRPLTAPARAYDSRNDPAGKLSGGTGSPRTINITSAVPAVPSAAVGVTGNLAVTQEAGNGFATIWPSGAWPGTANINFVPGVDLSNSFAVGLSGSGTVQVASLVPTHVVIDVAAYIL